jgi:hypothetical protein
MADIDIERKRTAGTGSPWPWIIGLVVVALVAWGIWEWMRTDEPPVAVEAPMEMPATEPAAPPAMEMAGQRLQAWARDSVPQMAQGAEMQIVQDGMQRVTNALERLARTGTGTVQTQPTTPGQPATPGQPTTPADQPVTGQPAQPTDAGVDQRLQQLRQQTQQLAGLDAATPQAANQTRQVFLQAVQVLEDLGRQPQLSQANLQNETGAARTAAESIDMNQPLAQQRQAIQRYFEAMGNAIGRAEQHR